MAKKKTDEPVACDHPMKNRKIVDGDLVCGVCSEVLKKKEEKRIDLFAEDCPNETLCASAGDDCTSKGHAEREGACFEPCDVPGSELPEDDPFGEMDVVETTTDTSEVALEVPDPEPDFTPETACCDGETVTQGGVVKTFTKPLPVMVTPIQLGEYSLEQATLWRELKEAEEAKKASAKAYSDRITRLENRLEELSKIITEGTIETPIECQWQFDFEHGVKRLVRLDWGTVVDEQTLTPEEYQQDLKFVEERSVAAVEEAFSQREAVEGKTEEIPFECPECHFKNGNHSPVCPRRPEEQKSLCACGICGHEDTIIPFEKCPVCEEGLMEPSDIGEYPDAGEVTAGEPT